MNDITQPTELLPVIGWLESKGFVVLAGRRPLGDDLHNLIVGAFGETNCLGRPMHNTVIKAWRKTKARCCNPFESDFELTLTPATAHLRERGTKGQPTPLGEELCMRLADCLKAEYPNMDFIVQPPRLAEEDED